MNRLVPSGHRRIRLRQARRAKAGGKKIYGDSGQGRLEQTGREAAMQEVSITIDVKARDIPTLICGSDRVNATSDAGYVSVIANAVAETLGLQDYLSHPNRVDELRRLIWQSSPGL